MGTGDSGICLSRNQTSSDPVPSTGVRAISKGVNEKPFQKPSNAKKKKCGLASMLQSQINHCKSSTSTENSRALVTQNVPKKKARSNHKEQTAVPQKRRKTAECDDDFLKFWMPPVQN